MVRAYAKKTRLKGGSAFFLQLQFGSLQERGNNIPRQSYAGLGLDGI
jgi:hypothetical protein